TSIEPRIDSIDTISAEVFRLNKTKLINNVTEEPRYVASHGQMRSALCAPVSPAVTSDTVYGVINLEASRPTYYQPDHKSYVETLCHIAGLHVEKLRSQRFLIRMVQALSKPLEHGALIRESLQLIKDLAGYALLMFVLKNKTTKRWELVEVDG